MPNLRDDGKADQRTLFEPCRHRTSRQTPQAAETTLRKNRSAALSAALKPLGQQQTSSIDPHPYAESAVCKYIPHQRQSMDDRHTQPRECRALACHHFYRALSLSLQYLSGREIFSTQNTTLRKTNCILLFAGGESNLRKA
jgi:hypothetical protein